MKTKSSSLLAGLLAVSAAQAAINIDTVPVGDAGNPNDSTGYGQVNYDYHIGTYEVTNAQYATFLNSVAATDTYSLYNTGMASFYGGITRNGSSGSYNYSTVAGRENNPVNYVSFWDAARFTNWLTTGDTETGVYNLNGVTNLSNNFYPRDMAAWNNGGVAVASENEWHKAAFYDPTGADGDGYWLYPTQSNSISTADANYNNSAGFPANVTEVGSYGISSYYGTFDQGGNVREWNDEIYSSNRNRGLLGGAFNQPSPDLQSTTTSSPSTNTDPTSELFTLGFRVTSLDPIVVPEPSTYAAILGGLGLLMVVLRKTRK